MARTKAESAAAEANNDAMTSNDRLLTMSNPPKSKLQRYSKLCRQYITGIYPWYSKLNIAGKLSLLREIPLSESHP
jgi:hypothetical protein